MSELISFAQLGIEPTLCQRLTELGYETPTPIQAQSIPHLLEKHDLVAQAQTGTGKTASFALPILMQIDLDIRKPQALVIAPTRELAIQVAEAFQTYAKAYKGFSVTPIYGGQDYGIQLKALKRGTHVIVGTPGRLIDHLERGSLNLNQLKTLVLDEGDEMLKMGFIDDIERILSKIEHPHQTTLFSATMPESIQKIAKRYMKDAKQVKIQPQSNHVETIEQAVIRVSRHHKLEALTRLLEIEPTQAVIIFVRTKNISAELSEKLQARGHSAAALNGDMSQSMREKIIRRLKKGSLDILVATDVAARGIDVERISHVINYDIPYDTESYIHRIGRTGRAGRSGKAFLFVEPREGRLLKDIERATSKTISTATPPTIAQLVEKRQEQWSEKIQQVSNSKRVMDKLIPVIEKITQEHAIDTNTVAAALLHLLEASNPLPQEEVDFNPQESHTKPGRKRTSKPRSGQRSSASRDSRKSRFGAGTRQARPDRHPVDDSRKPKSRPSSKRKSRPDQHAEDAKKNKPSSRKSSQKNFRKKKSDDSFLFDSKKPKAFKKRRPEKPSLSKKSHSTIKPNVKNNPAKKKEGAPKRVKRKPSLRD